MTKARMSAGLLTGCLLLWAGSAWSAPTVAEMLSLRPKQEGVVISTPTAQEQDTCKVEAIGGSGHGGGWLLRDPRGLPLRRFYNSRYTGPKDGTGMDVWSYYKDGVEVYREIDSNFNGKVDQYRWFGPAGMKWGIDLNEDGKIDAWQMISAEEVSQEVLQAVLTRDLARLQALVITDKEMTALELPAADVKRIQELRKNLPAKFQATCAKLTNLDPKTHWVRLETAAPQCTPADGVRRKHDLIEYQSASILYESGNKQDWLQTGEMIRAGLVWRLVDAPLPGDATVDDGPKPTDPEVQKLLDAITALDTQQQSLSPTPGPNPALVRYNLQRAEVIERLLAKLTKPEEKDNWVRQLADCLSAAAQSSAKDDKGPYERLVRLEEKTAREQPGSSLASYVTFREMTADYASKLTEPDFRKVQEQWVERLKKFVQTYGRTEDTPDALLQLGMTSESLGQETEAKNWYEQLVTNFPAHPLVPRAKGALNRFGIEGKVLTLAGTTLEGGRFDLAQLRSKVVVIYYWATWNKDTVGEFAKLRLLLNTYGAKGVELVCVNVDASADEAKAYLQRSPSPGVQLFEAGGLEKSPLAVEYGIMVLPNLFLVNRDGKVASRTVQMNNLEDEVKRLVK
jgi:thiol-disulfide isomerase/thioredoxin